MCTLKISIVTICYNNAKQIRATIESVVNQSYKNIEYIIIDGKSSDDSPNIIREYEKHLYKYVSEPDQNLYDAINKGLKLATGDVVGLIHAGDRLFNNEIIQKIADHFYINDIDIMYGNSILVNDKNIPVRVNRSPEYKKYLVKMGWMPSHQSIYMKKEILDKTGYYNLDLHPSADYEFFLRYFYFNNYKIKRLNEFVLRFATGGRSTRNYMNNLRGQKQHIQCWKVNGEKPPFFLIPLKLLRKPRQFAVAAFYRITRKFCN